MLQAVVYRSEAVLPEADVSNIDILREALARNPGLELTGFLYREHGRFLQVLEGPRGSIESMMARIRKDWRHRSIVVLEEGSLTRRRFGEWSMGCSGPAAQTPSPGVIALSAPEAVDFLAASAARQAAALRRPDRAARDGPMG